MKLKKILYLLPPLLLIIAIYSALPIPKIIQADDLVAVDRKDEDIQSIIQIYDQQLKNNPTDVRLNLAIGDGYYALQNYKEAEKHYKIALESDPGNENIKLSLANTYLNSSQLAKANELFKEVLLASPDNPKALAGLGKEALKKGNFEQAADLLDQSLVIDREDPTTLFYQAELNIEEKDFREAREILLGLQKKDPTASWINEALIRAEVGPAYEKGKQLLNEGKPQEALEIYQQALEKYPNNEEILAALAQFYLHEGDRQKAIEVLNQGLISHPGNRTLQLALGFAYLSLKDEENARAQFLEVEKNTGGDAEAKAGLGRIEEFKGNDNLAEQYYKEALIISPDDPLALSYLAHLKVTQRKYAEAVQIYEKIEKTRGRNDWVMQAIQEARSAPVLENIHQLEMQAKEPGSPEFAQIVQMYQKLLSQFPQDAFNYLQFGRFLTSHGLNSKAIQVYRRGLTHQPNSQELQLAIGQTYLLGKKKRKAREMFQLVLSKDPNNSAALLGMGKLYAMAGNANRASSLYEKVLAKNPDDLTALSYYSDLSVQEKNYPLASQLYKRILHIKPQAEWAEQGLLRTQFGPQLDEINSLVKEGHYQEAESGYHSLLNAAPRLEDAYLGLGQLYMSQGNYSAAIRLYSKKMAEFPESIEIKVRLGLAYLQKGKIKRAEKLLSKTYRQAPGNPEILAGLGRIAALKGDNEKAEEYFKRALSIDPNRLLALSYYANFLMQQKKFSEAAEIYQHILQLDPQALWAYEGLENAHFGPALQEIAARELSQDYSQAVEMYLSLIQQAPERADFIIKLGQLYAKTKHYHKAIALYQGALSRIPDSLEIKTALGIVLLQAGDLPKGRKQLMAVLKKAPQSTEAIAGLGYYYQLKGDPAQAEILYAKSLSYNPDQITALSFLAPLLMQEKRYQEAKEVLTRISKLDPSASWTALAIQDAIHGPLLDQVKAAEERKDYKYAEQLWNQLLSEAPQVIPNYLRVGFFYQRLLEYDKAIAVFKKGLELDPSSADLHASLGLAYLSKKEYPQAKLSFEAALHLDPLNPDALAGLGYVEFVNKNYLIAKQLMEQALKIDPNRPAALSSMGELLMKLKDYKAAENIYVRLLELSPNEKWIKLELEDARNGLLLDRIELLVKEEQYQEAADIYSELLQRSPGNPRYYIGYGYMFIKLKEYAKAIPIFDEGLQINPESNELRVSLGYAFLFNNDLMQAGEVLQQAVEKDNKNPEALAGLGRVMALNKDYCTAEELFIRAIQFDPKNLSALTFYGDLLMKQKRYEEAQELFAILAQLLPDAIWVNRAWQDAQDGPLMDLANRYADREDFELALDLYCRLLRLSPDDPARYLPLGQMYLNLQRYNCAIEVYMQGIALDPEAWYLWRALGIAYIYKEQFEKARCIFLSLLDNDPEDVEAWAGLGRVEALNGSLCKAHDYYEAALVLAPDNLMALSFLADLYQFEHYYFSSLSLYEEMIRITDEGHEAAGGCGIPKWLKRGYQNILNLTMPTLSVKGNYYEEDQWDHTVHRWSARYAVYGGTALINYPFQDNLNLWGSFTEQFFELKDLLNHEYLYSFDVQRFYLGSNWVISPCFQLDAQGGITIYSPYRRSSFCSLRGLIGELSFNFIYRQPIERASLGFFTRSDLVARDFSTNEAKLVGYYFIEGTYERKIYRRTWAGVIGDLYWYDDFAHNRGQRALAWIQWRPPCYSDNILFRYHFKYQSFAKNIPDYYTYKPQLVNHLQVTLEKYWRVCWADTFYTSLSYAHGWQDTRTRFAQNIVIAPDVAFVGRCQLLPPMQWDRRQYNLVVGNIIYKCNQLQALFNADYYRDTEKYTIWSVNAELIWRF